MSLRGKTRRRLFTLTMIILMIGAVGGGGAAVRFAYLRKAAQRGRVEGLAAMEQGDYAVALKSLGKYLSRYPNDPDILLAYARARQNVEEPNGENLGQAISLYQRALEIRPQWSEAQQSLLDLYVQIGFNTETIGLADQILAQNQSNSTDPHYTHALRCKIVSLMRMQRLDDAQRQMELLTKIQPLDLEVRILELQIMLKKQSPDRILAYASKLADQHPNDSRFDLLKSIAASLAGDNKAAADIVRPLVKRPLVDAAYTRYLIRQLDCVELFDDSASVLQQAAKSGGDRDLKLMLIRRLYETGQFQQLVDQTADLDPASSTADVESLAMREQALGQLKRMPEANRIVDALAARGQTQVAALKWAAALRAIDGSEDSVKRMTALRDALVQSPSNPILEEDLADAYSELGLHDKANSGWRDVTRLAPEWSAPLVRISQTLINAGRPGDAIPFANGALLRAPHNHDARIAAVVAGAATLPQGPSVDADKILSTIAKMRVEYPDDPELLPLQVEVLALKNQRDEAIKTVRAAISSNPVPAERMLLSLAQASRTFGLNLEEECFDAGQKAYGLTVDLAVARAFWLLDHNRGSDAMALMQQGLSAHPGEVLWQTAWAQYLDTTGDPRAKVAWVALGDANPASVKLQWGAVSARSVQADHEFVGRTIDRLVSLLGDDSLSLHLLRARWYLHGSSTDSDTTQAAILLGEVSRNAPDMLAPRLLLASCYMRLGNITGAIDELATASDAQPETAGLAIEVARLLYVHGDYYRSREYIDRAIHSKRANLPVIRQAARLLALQGDYTAAQTLLQKTYDQQKDAPPDIVLASLYRQLNQPEKTAEICNRLLEKPDATSIAFAADFYASQGKLDKAGTTLKMLDTLKLPPGNRDLILANYNSHYGKPEDALNFFKSAAHDAPKEPIVWQQLINYCFGTGRIEEAINAATDAAKNITNAPGFGVVRDNATLLKDARELIGIRPLLMTLGGDSKTNTAILSAIQDLVTAAKTQQPPSQTAVALRQLADQNPHVLALQSATLELYVESGKVDDAVLLANRTVQDFPIAVEPVRAETSLFTNNQRWDDVIGAAKEWRRRDPSETVDADLAMADAEFQMGDISKADQQIQPYLDRATHDPENFSGVLLLRARGLLATHQPTEVENLLGPLLPRSQKLRAIWIILAVRSVEEQSRSQSWLEKISPLVPPGSDEQVNLANAWMGLATRWNNPAYKQTGAAMLQKLSDPADAPISALLSWGSYCEESSNLDGAATAYNRVLTRDPNNAVACNNLASVLVHSNGDLNKAGELADKAIALADKASVLADKTDQLALKRPAFLDTKAMVQTAKKDYDNAIITLREAQRIDQKTMEWRVNLLANMVYAGRTRDAKAEMQSITSAIPTFVNTPPSVQQRYQLLCDKLNK